MSGSPPGAKTVSPLWAALAAVLWLVSLAGGLYALYSLSKLGATLYALLDNTYYAGVFTSQLTAVLAALGFIVMFIVTGEYHLKHVGERRSWILFAWVLGLEAVLILAGLLFG